MIWGDSELYRSWNVSQIERRRREEWGQVRTALHHNRADHLTCMLSKDTVWKKERKFQYCFGIMCLKPRSYYLSHIANKYNGDFPTAMIIKALKNISYSEETLWGKERQKINQNCYAKTILHLIIPSFFNTSSYVHHHIIMGSHVKGEFSDLQITSRSSPYCLTKKVFIFYSLFLYLCCVANCR